MKKIDGRKMGNNKTHGMSSTPLHATWASMRQRCLDPNQQTSKNYFEKGITFCPRWNKFENFFQDMIPTWKKGLTLDRIDNEKGYFPQNCRWATMKEQSLNRSTTVRINYDGRSMNLEEVSKMTGVPRDLLWRRLHIYKWSFEKAITTPKLTCKTIGYQNIKLRLK